VVTPVYNEQEHLAECIESVLAQTYTNWDYTIVDNCSTDATLEIARSYAARDSRIRVVENRDFLDAFSNCNVAVRQASPDSNYCKVVLGDDWIYPECLERMVAVAEEFPSVGVVGAYALEGTEVRLSGLPYNKTVISGREVCRRTLLERLYVFGTQNSVLYRTDLVKQHDPLYNVANVQADTEACFALLMTSDFGFVHQVLTYTRVRPGSLNAKSQALQTAWAAILLLLKKYGPNCLTPDELEAALARHLSAYYKFLGKSLLLKRDEKFWAYHKQQLESLSPGYSRLRLARGVVGSLWSLIGRPGVAMEHFFHSANP
jgi:glycosyltransferase involved in cell wall biosynthesis